MEHNLWILTSPRTGSTMLCNILNNCGLIPQITEVFHPCRIKQLTLPGTNKMLSNYPFKNELIMKNPKKLTELLLTKYPDMKFIVLQRDIVEQITSWHIAYFSNIWHIRNPKKEDCDFKVLPYSSSSESIKILKSIPLEQFKVTSFSVSLFKKYIEYVETYRFFLEEQNISHLNINFNDLSLSNNNDVWENIFNYIGLDIKKIPTIPTIKNLLIPQKTMAPEVYSFVQKKVKNYL